MVKKANTTTNTPAIVLLGYEYLKAVDAATVKAAEFVAALEPHSERLQAAPQSERNKFSFELVAGILTRRYNNKVAITYVPKPAPNTRPWKIEGEAARAANAAAARLMELVKAVGIATAGDRDRKKGEKGDKKNDPTARVAMYIATIMGDQVLTPAHKAEVAKGILAALKG